MRDHRNRKGMAVHTCHRQADSVNGDGSFLDNVAKIVSSPLLQGFLYAISFNNRFYDFTLGIIQLKDVVFFLSVMFL